jgi:CRISPR/Cas system-associated protein Cas10 (large subunit of type III CRISPR-Cas system)
MRSDIEASEAFTADERAAWEGQREEVETPKMDTCDRCGREVPKGTLKRRSDKRDDQTEYLCSHCG